MALIETQFSVGENTFRVAIDQDSRLKVTARWSIVGEHIHIRVPRTMRRGDIDQMVRTVRQQLERRLKARKRTPKASDAELERRAAHINRQYFNDELQWASIRWVSNMRCRLGSCSTGGMTDGEIRISERIRHWPAYVIDYVIAHEICHRKYPDHSPEYWAYLARCPFVERAIGFIQGVSYAEHMDIRSEDDLVPG